MNERSIRLGKERSAIRELYEYGKELAKRAGEENVFDFSIGNPAVPAPACVAQEIERLMKTMPAAQLHGYTSAAGDADVRKRISDRLKARFCADIPANLIYMTCGAAASLTITLNALLSGGEEVVVISPYFPEYRVFIERAGGVVKEVRANGEFHLDIGAIQDAVTPDTAAVIVNTPNNPTGAVYTGDELNALASVLRAKSKQYRKSVYLISDEPYRELNYTKEAPFVANYYENTVVCYSFSKSLSLAGERVGYIAINGRAENAETLFYAVCGAGRSLGFVCAPALFQRVVAACCDETADKSVYEENGKLLYDGLTGAGYSAIKPQGAFYLFVKSPLPDAAAFSRRAKEYGLLIVPSDSFGIRGYVRISTCVPRERVERALPLFKQLIEELQG